MNTVFFYILQGLFGLLYFILIALWYKLKNYKAYSQLPKGKHYRFATLYIVAVAAVIIAAAFIADDPAKFRLTLMTIMLAPVLLLQIKSIMAYVSIIKELTKAPKPELNLLRLRCLLLLKCSILFYAVVIPMLIIYLK